MADDKNKQLFLSLIYTFQMQTMMQLGKLANPMTGSIEKELDGAQVTIDMLDMLKAKSKGNTTEDETRFLDQVIADLKLNYVEERDKEKSEPAKAKDKKITAEAAAEYANEPKSGNTGDQKISSDKSTEKKEESKSGNSEDKKKSSNDEANGKEKPLTEKEIDGEKPLPPQE